MPLPQIHPAACSFRKDSEIFGLSDLPESDEVD
jgi:hypothetical protein